MRWQCNCYRVAKRLSEPPDLNLPARTEPCGLPHDHEAGGVQAAAQAGIAGAGIGSAIT